MLLREFLEAMQDNGPLASLSSMEAYCQKHGGATNPCLLPGSECWDSQTESMSWSW